MARERRGWAQNGAQVGAADKLHVASLFLLTTEASALIVLSMNTAESLTSIASNLGAQTIAHAAECERDVWAKVDAIAADFEASVLSWQSEARQAGDYEVFDWADDVLSLDDAAPVRDAYLAAAEATATKIAGPR